MQSEEKRKYDREYHKNRSPNKKLEKLKKQKERKLSIAKAIKDYKIGKVCKCGESHPACLEFHHKSNKEINIADATQHGWSLDRIFNEIKKCDLICANCHRKLHNK